MTVVLPSLDPDGWVTYPGRILDYIASHLFESDYSQTYCYRDFVTSLAWIIEETHGDYNLCQSMLESRLTTYFSRYFNNVVVQVSVGPSETDSNQGVIKLFAEMVGKSDGVTYNLGRMIRVQNSKIREVVTLSNFGTDKFQTA